MFYKASIHFYSPQVWLQLPQYLRYSKWEVELGPTLKKPDWALTGYWITHTYVIYSTYTYIMYHWLKNIWWNKGKENIPLALISLHAKSWSSCSIWSLGFYMLLLEKLKYVISIIWKCMKVMCKKQWSSDTILKTEDVWQRTP